MINNIKAPPQLHLPIEGQLISNIVLIVVLYLIVSRFQVVLVLVFACVFVTHAF